MFGQDFDVKVWSKDFEFWNLIKICVRTCYFGKQNSTLGSVVPLAVFCNYIEEECLSCSSPHIENMAVKARRGRMSSEDQSRIRCGVGSRAL